MLFDVLGPLLLALALVAGWFMTLVNLPGNWVMAAAVALYTSVTPLEARFRLGWPIVAIVVGLALLGELVEFLAGALGATRAGASRRGAMMAIVGSMIGGVVGAVVGLPIPIVGSVVAAVLFAALGALAGAMAAESSQRTTGELWQIGWGAFWGRLLGTLGKVLAGSLIAVTAMVALFV